MDAASEPKHAPSGVVSLAYLGTDRSLIEVAPNHLKEFGLTGTFLLEPAHLVEHLAPLTQMAEAGHEMGSACFYGCDDGNGNLLNWTLEMVESELLAARKLLSESFPRQTDYPFAYPGADCRCLTSSFDPQPATYRRIVEQHHSVALWADQGFNDSETCVLSELSTVSGEDLDASALTEIADRAMARKSWAILVFEGVGAGRHGTDAYVHQAMCRHLAQRSSQVLPVLQMAYEVRKRREADWQKLRKLKR